MDWHSYDSSTASGSLSSANSEVRGYVERLEHKLNSLGLACQALWEILQDNMDISEIELANRMQEIDLRDGVADGKITHTVITCEACGRKTTRRRSSCMYCGAPIASDEEPFAKE